MEGTTPPLYPKAGNYRRYSEAPFNRPEFYPLNLTPAADRYRPIARWVGRLVLPAERDRRSRSVLLEVHHAPVEYAHVVGETLWLSYSQQPEAIAYLEAATQDVRFRPQGIDYSQRGSLFPTRITGWQAVNPLELLAAGHPVDDVTVALPEPVSILQSGDRPTLQIAHDPIQITGRYCGLVRFLKAIDSSVDRSDGPQRFRVVHYNKATRDFDGDREEVWLPQVVTNQDGLLPFTNDAIEQSPENLTGWYIFGALDASEMFVVQAIAPRALFQLKPDRTIVGRSAVRTYLKKKSWANLAAQKGRSDSVILTHHPQQLQTDWQVGQRLLLIHIRGGIGGQDGIAVAKRLLYPGHLTLGIATVVQEPLTDELRFDIVYYPICPPNSDGLLSGTLHWSRYMGDRQFGWLGTHPIADTLIGFEPFTEADEPTTKEQRSPLDELIRRLEITAACYRMGHGKGGLVSGLVGSLGNSTHRAIQPLQPIARELTSWHGLLPRLATDSLVEEYLKQGAIAWMLRTNQLGGYNPRILPLAPLTL